MHHNKFFNENSPPLTPVAGIEQGPYPAAPQELVDHYVQGHARAITDPSISDEQLTADVQSEWQYDQHCAAVERALEDGRITPLQADHMYDVVLRPWWIGYRYPPKDD